LAVADASCRDAHISRRLIKPMRAGLACAR
jgi:hypothetical protein